VRPPIRVPAPPFVPAGLPVLEPVAARLERSPDFGPVIEELRYGAPTPQDHEITLTTRWHRITLADADPANALVEPLYPEPGRRRSDDGTWGTEERFAEPGGLFAGPIVDGELAQPVRIHRGYHGLVHFLGGVGQPRTVVAGGTVGGWHLMTSVDGGRRWTTERFFARGSLIPSSRRSIHFVTDDDRWLAIDREGYLTTVPIETVDVGWDACASAALWVPYGDQVRWFFDGLHGVIDVRAVGRIGCVGEAALIPTYEGRVRCTRIGCGPAEPRAEFADLTADGIASANQHASWVRISRTNQPTVDVELDRGDQVVALVVWDDRPTLVVLGASRRLHLAQLRYD
jgi:hypothetical protein